jgi:PAS domain S-box-containing protein
MSDDAKAAWPWVLGLTALAFAAIGWLTTRLVSSPIQVAPLFPSAGIAFAAVWVYGRPALAGVALGAFGLLLFPRLALGQFELTGLARMLWITFGATLQAWVACALVRRFVAQPLTLEQPRDIWRFLLLSAPLACLTSATVATAALVADGALPLAAAAPTWRRWWIADALGMLIAAPAALAFIGRPRSAWRPRRATVAAPLLAATVLLLAATLVVARWDEQRARDELDRRAAAMTRTVSDWLNDPLQALQAVHGLFLVQPRATREDLRRATAWWLQQDAVHLHAIGYAEQVPRAELRRFEQAVQAQGLPDFRVFDRDAPQAAPAPDEPVLAIRAIEPQQPNAGALGLNVLSIEAVAAAVQRAQRSGEPSASAAFALTHQPDAGRIGVAVVQTLAGPVPGAVFVTVRLDQVLQRLLPQAAAPLRWCLIDLEAGAMHRRLAGADGCEHAARQAYTHDQPLRFAGRDWQLRIDADPLRVRDAAYDNAWLFSVLGLIAASLLGALLLIVTARARRIELEVEQRTHALRHEAGERQRTEEALSASEQQLRAILDAARVGIVKTDLLGRILQPNAAFVRMVGYSAAELRALSVGHITHPDDRAEDARLLATMRDGTSDVYRREKRYLAKDGQIVHTLLTVALLRDAQGRAQATVGVIEDIGERLRLAEAERARELAESSNRAKSEFVSRMSHELRTPLNAMLGFAQLLGLDRMPALADHQRAWATQIQQAGWHLLHMINDTLDLSRIESGMLKLEPARLEPAALVEAALAMVEPAAAKRGLHIEQQTDPRAGAVLADETRVKQILTNLLSNAVKYNVDAGQIAVRVRATTARTIEFVVSDSGLGMTREQMDELFQPYNRLGRERSGIEGTGIGLVISRRLAELMGGSLRAHSVAGEGSTFILNLPRAPDNGSDGEPVSEPAARPAAYHQRLVHYIEDNETNIEVMRGMLLRRPQVQLQVSMNGLDGLAALKRQRPSLILLDVHLPDIDGLELLRHLKDDDDLSSIPVVVVSADATTTQIEAALTAGAAHYVTKPVSLAALLEVLDGLLDEMDTHFG